MNRGWRFCRPLPYHLATAPIGLMREELGEPCGREGWLANRSSKSPPEGPPSPGYGGQPPHLTTSGGWSGKRDSNPRLRPWQGRTLPLSYSRARRVPRPPNVPQPSELGQEGVPRLRGPGRRSRWHPQGVLRTAGVYDGRRVTPRAIASKAGSRPWRLSRHSPRPGASVRARNVRRRTWVGHPRQSADGPLRVQQGESLDSARKAVPRHELVHGMRPVGWVPLCDGRLEARRTLVSQIGGCRARWPCAPGGALAKQGKLADAKRCHRRATRAPADPLLARDEPYFNLGLIDRAERRYKEALVNFDRAIALDPNYALALEARADVQAALQLEVPDDRSAHWRRMLNQPACDATLHELVRAYTTRYPARFGGWVMLADALAGFAQYADASTALRRAEVLAGSAAFRRPGAAWFAQWRGGLYREKRDFRRAEQYLSARGCAVARREQPDQSRGGARQPGSVQPSGVLPSAGHSRRLQKSEPRVPINSDSSREPAGDTPKP